VHGEDGKPLPVGATAVLEGGASTLVGYDGVVFAEGLKPHNRLVVGQGADACTLQFDYTPSAGGALPTIGPLVCARTKETSR
jgi:outer membrane usher protein